MSYPISAEPSVHAWLDNNSDRDEAWETEEFFFQLVEDPKSYPEVHFPGEPLPRRYAAVPENGVVITYVVRDDPKGVHILKLEKSGGLWVPPPQV